MELTQVTQVVQQMPAGLRHWVKSSVPQKNN
jgi:hypothetical protein